MIYLLAFLFTFQPAPDTTAVQTEVQSATVYLSGAEVQRNTTVTLSPGTNHIHFTGLSSSLNEETLQLKASGDIILESISKTVNYNSEQNNQELANLQTQKEDIERQIKQKQAQLTVLERKLNVLVNNQDISGESAKVSAAELQQAVEFFENQFEEIEMRKLELQEELEDLNEQLRQINQEINVINNKQRRAAARVEMAIQSDSRQQLTLNLSYFVASAGWSPSYDARVEDIDQPLELRYKADIAQNTGVDWNDVNLTISSARPRRNASLPDINPIYLEFYEPRPVRTSDVQMEAAPQQFKLQNLRSAGEAGISQVSGVVLDAQSGEPIPGANIYVQETDQGTTTNRNGEYSLGIDPNAKMVRVTLVGYQTKEIPITSSRMNITLNQSRMALDEIVVTSYGSPVENQLQQGQTSFSYQIKTPYTIKSGEAEKTVAVESYSLPASYNYFAIPREDTDAFLTANISDWESLNLLPGRVNLFLDNAYVGQTNINRNTVQDTLSFSLGTDDGIVIERDQIESFREKNFFGNRVTETQGYEITLRNTKSSAIDINIEDQVPISRNEDIEVDLEETSGAGYNESTGILEWNISLDPSESRKLRFVYEITYPSGKQLQTRR